MGKKVQYANVELRKLTFNQADRGAKFLRMNMPHEYGEMKQAVADPQTRRGNGYAIVSRTPKNQKDSKGRNTGKRTPYHIFYDKGKAGYRGQVKNPSKTGYYQKTYNFLLREYPKRISKDLKKIFRG